MKRSFLGLLGAAAIGVASSPVSAATGTCQLAGGGACTSVAPPVVAAPSGMAQYCSMTWPGGNWGFKWSGSLTGDPCTTLITRLGSGGTIQRAGMYSTTGISNVVARCGDGVVITFGGTGGTPLNDAYNAAQGHPSCVFTVAPREFPVFDSPFSLSPLPTGYEHGTGFDFARWPYLYVDLLNDFRETGGITQSFVLDYQGTQRDGSPVTTITSGSNGATLPISTIDVASTSGFTAGRTLSIGTTDAGAQKMVCGGSTSSAFTSCTSADPSNPVTGTLATGGVVAESYGFIDDHQGHDFVMDEGTPIRAVADGVVDMARYRASSGAACDLDSNGQSTGPQGEVYIRHRFSGGSATYDDWYESYYAHFTSSINGHSGIVVSTGQVVHKGDIIGYSGHSGCTSGTNHLHMSVFRLTNTATAMSFPLVINTDFSTGHDQNSDLGYQIVTDPYGFYAPTSYAFDPWAWRAYSVGRGALSVNLWDAAQDPPLSPHSGWAVEW